jgi:hypothetical protein
VGWIETGRRQVWCLIGDFHVLGFPLERLGCNVYYSGMAGFSEFIINLNLVDFPLECGAYGWLNNQDPHSMSQIDWL